jgi:hypothetical protein
MSEELKPCPFCGGLAELDTSQAYRALSSGALGSRAAVYCTRCGAEVGFCYEDAPGTPREDIVNQVVDDWNRRAPSPDMREAVEALTARLDELCAIRCQNDMGFDRETGPLGCRLDGDGTGCLCAAHVPAMRDAASMFRALTGAKP